MIEKTISVSKEMVRNPYETILSWSEQRLKLTGAKIFSIASLQPISLVMPEIVVAGNKVPPNINLLVLSPSSSGKTTCAKMFENITYNPIPFESITSARFEEEIYGKNHVSLICSDVARIFRDPTLIKTIEGVSGEEKRISRLTMRKTRDFSINSVFFGLGLPEAITKWISYGLLQRLTPVVVFHTREEQLEIGRWLTKNINLVSKKEVVSTEQVRDYYKKIWNVQHSKDEEQTRITGYVIEEDYKQRILEQWEALKEELKIPDDTYIIRELQSAYKYMFAHSMLNLFNRKKEENKIVVDKEDLQVGLHLFTSELRTKMMVWNLDNIIKKSTNVQWLYDKIVSDEQISPVTKKIAKVMLENK